MPHSPSSLEKGFINFTGRANQEKLIDKEQHEKDLLNVGNKNAYMGDAGKLMIWNRAGHPIPRQREKTLRNKVSRHKIPIHPTPSTTI